MSLARRQQRPAQQRGGLPEVGRTERQAEPVVGPGRAHLVGVDRQLPGQSGQVVADGRTGRRRLLRQVAGHLGPGGGRTHQRAGRLDPDGRLGDVGLVTLPGRGGLEAAGQERVRRGRVGVRQALVDLLRVQAQRLADRDHVGGGRRVLIGGQRGQHAPGQAEQDQDDEQQPEPRGRGRDVQTGPPPGAARRRRGDPLAGRNADARCHSRPPNRSHRTGLSVLSGLVHTRGRAVVRPGRRFLIAGQAPRRRQRRPAMDCAGTSRLRRILPGGPARKRDAP